MPVLPQNLVLYGRLGLILAVLGSTAGCARFPDSGAVGNFTRIRFKIRVNGTINDSTDSSPLTQYVYIIAIRVLQTDDIPNTGAPIPVANETSPNGFVAGSPTHFVQYDSLRPSQPFILYKFNPGPAAGDPTNPVNLGSWFDTSSTRGRIINFVRPSDAGGSPKEFQFDLFANQLVNVNADAGTIRRLQVNILTMNRLSTSGGSRVWDAVGNSLSPSEINSVLTVDLRSNSTVNNTTGIEPTGDTVGANDPDADISDFTIEVQRP